MWICIWVPGGEVSRERTWLGRMCGSSVLPVAQSTLSSCNNSFYVNTARCLLSFLHIFTVHSRAVLTSKKGKRL